MADNNPTTTSTNSKDLQQQGAAANDDQQPQPSIWPTKARRINKENLRADQQQDSVNDDEKKSPSSFSFSPTGVSPSRTSTNKTKRLLRKKTSR